MTNKDFSCIINETFDDSKKISLNILPNYYTISVLYANDVRLTFYNYDMNKYLEDSVVNWYVEFNLNGDTINIELLSNTSAKLSIIKYKIVQLLKNINEQTKLVQNYFTKMKLNDKLLMREFNINNIINEKG